MKKILLVLILSLTMTCLFAGNFNATVSGGYGYKSFKMNKDKDIFLQFNAFDAQVGLNYVFDNNVYAFGDFSMMFPDEAKEGSTKDKKSSDEDWYPLAFTVGAGYKFDINEDFQVLTGLGFRYDNFIYDAKDNSEDSTITVLGLGLDLEGYYFFSDSFGLMVAAKPNLGFYTCCDPIEDSAIEKDDWMFPSFTFNATAGFVARF